MLTQLGSAASVPVSISVVGLPDPYAACPGASMTTPHVSAVAPLAWSRQPACSAAQVRAAPDANTFELGAAGRDGPTGNRLVQASAAHSPLTMVCGP